MFSRWSRSVLRMSNVIPLGLLQEFSVLSRCNCAAGAASPSASPPPPLASDPVDKALSNTPTVNLEKLFWSKPCSLALPSDSPLRIEEPNYEGIRQFILKMMLFYIKQCKSIRGANVVYKRIVSQVDKPAIYDGLHFPCLFFTCGYAYGATRRRGRKALNLDNICTRFTTMMWNYEYLKPVNLLLIRWMKDLEKIFYGNIVAYDSAMLPEAKHDELANALWRNILSDDGSPIPSDTTTQSAVQALARYARRECHCLSMTDKEAVFSGNFMFTSLKHEDEQL